MSNSITNLEIDKFVENEENEDSKKNCMRFCSIYSITRYIKFCNIIKNRNEKYPFGIVNTDKNNKPGKHWWSFLDIYPKKNLLLFDSLGLDGFKYFIVDNDENIIDKLLYNFKKCKIRYQKISLCSLKFSIDNWEKLELSKTEKLTDTAQKFVHLLREFAKLQKTNKMTILIAEHPVQNIIQSTCVYFDCIFIKTYLTQKKKSKIINDEFLNKKTIENILNEMFPTNVEQIEKEMKNFKEEYDL